MYLNVRGGGMLSALCKADPMHIFNGAMEAGLKIPLVELLSYSRYQDAVV